MLTMEERLAQLCDAIAGTGSPVVPHITLVRGRTLSALNQERKGVKELLGNLVGCLVIRIAIPSISKGSPHYTHLGREEVQEFQRFVERLKEQISRLDEGQRSPLVLALRARGICKIQLEIKENLPKGRKNQTTLQSTLPRVSPRRKQSSIYQPASL